MPSHDARRRGTQILLSALLSTLLIPALAHAQEPDQGDDASVEQESRMPYWLQYRLLRLRSQLSARDWLMIPSYTASTSLTRGGSTFASRDNVTLNPTARGYHLQERNGLVSGVMLAGLAYVGIASAASGLISSDYTTYSSSYSRREGNYWVTTTYTWSEKHSNAGTAAAESLVAGQNEMLGGIVGYRLQNFELDIYTRDWLQRGEGDTEGWRTNFMMMIPLENGMGVELGYGWGRARSYFEEAGCVVSSQYSGIPLRVLAPLGPFLFQSGLDMNFRGAFERLGKDRAATFEQDGTTYRQEHVRPWPLTLSVQTMLWRLNLSASVESSRILQRRFGYELSAGLRF